MLFVVACPLGNMDDLSPRAVEALKSADLLLCEDTRSSFPLLKYHDIGTKLKSYHKYNEQSEITAALDILSGGGVLALITDAGTPCISDPGAKLVAAVAEAGYNVTSIPGPCAAIAALSVSGFNAASFVFRGFLPRKKGMLARVITGTKSEPSPVTIFYESPLRIHTTMAMMAELVPDSRVCLCNDLTKPYERIYRGVPQVVLTELESNRNATKGEYTLVLARSNIKPEEADYGED